MYRLYDLRLGECHKILRASASASDDKDIRRAEHACLPDAHGNLLSGAFALHGMEHFAQIGGIYDPHHGADRVTLQNCKQAPRRL